MSRIVRVEIYVDTRVDTILRRVLKIIREHPGNDEVELICHQPDGLRVFTAERTVDSWDPSLHRKLKQAVSGRPVSEERSGDA